MPFSNTADDREALRFAYEMAQVFDAQLTVLCLVETPRSIRLQACPPERVQEGELAAAAAVKSPKSWAYPNRRLSCAPRTTAATPS
jgi:hypothetical protein